MKKFQFLYILAILFPCSLGAMNMQCMLRTPLRFEFQKRSCSGYNSPKSLGKLSFYEVNKLAQNKELAQKEFKSALARNEDTKAISASGEQLSDAKSLWRKMFRQFSTKTALASSESTEVKNAWKKTFAQFSIQDWNSMLLEREENTVLEAIHPHLPDFVKTNFKEHHERAHKSAEKVLTGAKQFYNAQALDESLQQYYEENLRTAGYYSKIPNIYQWKNNDRRAIATSTATHIYVQPYFFDLPLNEQLGILAHESEHQKNFHIHKTYSICSFPEKSNRYLYDQFQEKEADLKASAHGLTIAKGTLNYSTRYKGIYYDDPYPSHPSWDESINYTQNLIGKLEQEQKGYSWSPFHKILGLTEWLKK